METPTNKLIPRIYKNFFYTILIFLWLFAACLQPYKNKEIEKIAAMVNGEVITQEEFNLLFQRFSQRASLARQALDSEKIKKLKIHLINSLVEERLILGASKKAKLYVSEDEIHEYQEQTKKEYGSENFVRQLIDQSITNAEYRQIVHKQLLMQKLVNKLFVQQLVFSDEEVRHYYLLSYHDFYQPEQVHPLHIIVRTEEEAKRIKKQLEFGEEFGILAKRYSVAPEAKQGGDLGFFKRKVMPEIFDRVCFNLIKGKISDVIQSSYGFHIFKLLDRKKAGYLTFQEAKPVIIKKLKMERRLVLEEFWLDDLKRRAEIEIFYGDL